MQRASHGAERVADREPGPHPVRRRFHELDPEVLPRVPFHRSVISIGIQARVRHRGTSFCVIV